MSWPFRVTSPLLDVVQALVHADNEVHGWALAEQTGQSGPNVYHALARLRQAGWVRCKREARNPVPGKPPRTLYRLTRHGAAQARAAGGTRSRLTDVGAAPRALHPPPAMPVTPGATRGAGGRRRSEGHGDRARR